EGLPVLPVEQPRSELAGLHPQPQGADLHGGDRPPLGDDLPPRGHRLRAAPAANVGPGEGAFRRRRRGQQAAGPGTAGPVEGVRFADDILAGRLCPRVLGWPHWPQPPLQRPTRNGDRGPAYPITSANCTSRLFSFSDFAPAWTAAVTSRISW